MAIDRLRGYRFGDYQRLVAWLVDSLSGKGDPPTLGLPAAVPLSPGSVSEQFLWLTLLLILWASVSTGLQGDFADPLGRCPIDFPP